MLVSCCIITHVGRLRKRVSGRSCSLRAREVVKPAPPSEPHQSLLRALSTQDVRRLFSLGSAQLSNRTPNAPREANNVYTSNSSQCDCSMLQRLHHESGKMTVPRLSLRTKNVYLLPSVTVVMSYTILPSNATSPSLPRSGNFNTDHQRIYKLDICKAVGQETYVTPRNGGEEVK